MKGVNIFLADGFEDIEALAANDVLRRGGIQTRLVSMNSGLEVKSSHGVTIVADVLFSDICKSNGGTEENDVMVFPGGMPGTRNLAANAELIELMNAHYAAGGTVAAICAAPGLVLGQLRGVEEASFTCFEGFQKQPQANGWQFCRRPSNTSGRIITGRSAGFAVNFGLEILKKLNGSNAVATVESGIFSYGVSD